MNVQRAVAPLFLIILCCTVCVSQQTEPLSLNLVLSRELRAATSVPTTHWLDDGRLLLHDRSSRTAPFTVLDPASGQRQHFTDASKALAGLRALAGDTVAPRGLPFPEALDGKGRSACYIAAGDIFLLRPADALWTRLTATPAVEKCPSFSPDGALVAYVRDNNLYVTEVVSGKEKQLTSDGGPTLLNGTLSWVYWEEVFGRKDEGYWWSPDGQAIAYLQTDESPVSVQTYVDFKPWTPRVVTQRYPKVGEPNPRVRAGVVELATGRTVWIDLERFPFEYLVRVGWLPGGRTVALQTLNRLQTELRLLLADRRTGRATPVLVESDTTWVSVLDDCYFLNDGNTFLWPSQRDGYLHLYRYRLDGTLLNRVTGGPWSMRSAGGGVAWRQRAVVGIDQKNGWVYFTALEHSSIERHLYRVSLDGSGFRRLSKERGTHAVTFRDDCVYYVDRYSSASVPPVLTLHSADGARRVTLGTVDTTRLAPYNLQTPSFFTIPTRDGFPLPAQLLKPKDFDASKRYPVIFDVYGGPSAPRVVDSWQRDILWNNLLLQNGFLVMTVDNRSATGISKTLENTVSKRLMGEGELNDLVDAVSWTKQQPFVDPARIGLWGWSGGGTYTLLGMSRSREFAAGIAVAGVTDFRFYDTKWAEETMKTEAENHDGYEAVSLLRFARNLNGKLLLVHGTYDDNVHPQNTLAFVEELIQGGVLFEMMLYPMRGHGISDHPARFHLYSTMLDFWKRNL
jgi:dipeptidyl-peptidase-4